MKSKIINDGLLQKLDINLAKSNLKLDVKGPVSEFIFNPNRFNILDEIRKDEKRY